jgi:hypothetical protein
MRFLIFFLLVVCVAPQINAKASIKIKDLLI